MSSPGKSVSTNVRIRARLAARLERAATRMSRRKSWIVERALEQYLAAPGSARLADEARRQSRLASRGRRRSDNFWADHGDLSGWK
jgi:predicted transcriptional regulator